MRTWIRGLRVLAGVALLTAAAGCATDTSSPKLAHWKPDVRPEERMPWETARAPSPGSVTNRSESVTGRLRAGDHVVISLLGIVAPQEIKEVVDQNGCVTLPFIGQVKLDGLPTSEAEALIEKAYVTGGYYQKIDIVVVAQEYQYFVGGEVKAPGRYPLTPGITLLRAITAAGGYTEYADPSKITVRRGERMLRFNGNKIKVMDAEDPLVEPEDAIEVRRHGIL
jgi:polysaccharide biosynthesis/export protein VpsN